MPLDPQTRALVEQLQSGGFKPAHQIPIEESRAGLTHMAMVMAAPKVDLHATEDRAIGGPGGDLPIRIYRHAAAGEPAPAVVFFHGGGMYLGDLETHDHVCRYLCREAAMTVIAVDYRLAPEHKYPAQLEDCYAALCWAADNAAAIGIDPDRIALAGDSAGGTLVVACCLLARDRGGPAIAYQVAVYPALTMTDGEEFASRQEYGSGEYFISAEDFGFFREVYLAGTGADAHDPLVSPIYADHYRGLPPALVIAAGYDPCRDENQAYADRLAADGVPVIYRCFDSTIHPFFLFDGVIDAGREGQQLVADTLRDFFARS